MGHCKGRPYAHETWNRCQYHVADWVLWHKGWKSQLSTQICGRNPCGRVDGCDAIPDEERLADMVMADDYWIGRIWWCDPMDRHNGDDSNSCEGSAPYNNGCTWHPCSAGGVGCVGVFDKQMQRPRYYSVARFRQDRFEINPLLGWCDRLAPDPNICDPNPCESEA